MKSHANRARNLARSLSAVLCLLGTTSLLPAQGVADELPVTTLPGDPISRFTRMYQRQADRAFERGDYERAYRTYLRKLAPKGDKHAHYMLGHLNHQGLGVRQDPARALAWYALAAERGAAGARVSAEQLSAKLGASEQERADEILAELLDRYGDRRLLVKAIRRDQRELRKRTGSYVGSGIKPMLVVLPDGRTVSGDGYYGAIEERIRYRLQLLGGTVTIGEFELIDTLEGEAPQDEEP